MNEEEFVKDFNRTIGKLEGLNATEHQSLPNETDRFKNEIETLQARIEESQKEANR